MFVVENVTDPHPFAGLNVIPRSLTAPVDSRSRPVVKLPIIENGEDNHLAFRLVRQDSRNWLRDLMMISRLFGNLTSDDKARSDKPADAPCLYLGEIWAACSTNSGAHSNVFNRTNLMDH